MTFIASGNNGLELVMPLVDQWKNDLWVVTHVYIDRTAKVNARANLKKTGEINTSRKFLISNPTSHHTL